MVLLYQIAIFLIIILSSFAGFKGLIISVSAIVLFSISNIFTLQLLVIQFTTIVVATVIGAIIATIKLVIDMPKIVADKTNSIINYFDRNGFPSIKYFTQYLLRCLFRISVTAITVLIVGVFELDGESIFTGFLLVAWFSLNIYPLVTVTERNGGFIAESFTFRFFAALGCVYMGYRIAFIIYYFCLGLV